MDKKIKVDLNVPATARLKLLAELTRQAIADKKANKVEVVKSYFAVAKSIKSRFALACEANSQNEIMTDLMLKFAERFEKSKPKPRANLEVVKSKTTPIPEPVPAPVPAPIVGDVFDLSKFYESEVK
jgi:hypothetical protein